MIKLKEKIGYGFGDMASSMFWKLFGSYLMIFYTDVFGLPAAVVGTLFLVTRVWDSAFDPIVGVVADRTHSRWGKFRPYLLFLAIPFLVVIRKINRPSEWVVYSLLYLLTFLLPTFDFYPWSFGRLFSAVVLMGLMGRSCGATEAGWVARAERRVEAFFGSGQKGV